jgi:hypothetical protein
MLESRRKALASMKMRRSAVDAQKRVEAVADVPVVPTPAQAMVEGVEDERQRTIEDEVAELEKEVLGLASAEVSDQDDMDVEMEEDDDEGGMDVDEEPEEGEIVQSTLPTPPPPILPTLPVPTSLPVSFPRGIKRPVADDFVTKPMSSTRALPPAKRRVFGGPQRPHRLIISLDDSDSESEDEPAVDPPKAPKHLDQTIEDLRAQIAAKVKALQLKKEARERETAEGARGPVAITIEESAATVEMVDAAAEAVTEAVHFGV